MLGMQFQAGPTNNAKAPLLRAGIVKAIGEVGVLKLAKPTAMKIYRPRIPQSAEQFAADPYRQGQECAATAIAELGGWNDPHLYVETWNEPPGQRGPDREKLLTLVRGFSDHCHAQGYRVAGYCFATGNPEPEDVRYYAANGWGGVDLVAYHGYWGNQGLTDWHALRYRKIWTWSGGRCPPIVITESGRDAIEGGKRGWRNSCSEQQYRSELAQYRAALSSDQRQGIPVVGSTPFVWSPTAEWQPFDMEPFGDLIGDWEVNWALVSPAKPKEATMAVTRIGNNYEVIDLRAALPHPSSYPRRERSAIKYLVIHHSGVAGDQTALQTANYHVDHNGWPGIGYQFGVHPDGRTEMYHDIEEASYNVAYKNNEVLGIILYGDFSARPPGDTQLAAAKRLCAELQYDLGWFVPIVGHRDIATPQSPTTCPGDTWATWKASVITAAAPAPAPAPTVDWQAVATDYKRRLEQILSLAKV